MDLQWYPGHMTKAYRQMQEDIKLIDLIIEIVDARIPKSSRNPDIDRLSSGKSRIVLLNKSDLADPKINEAWIRKFKDDDIHAMLLDSRSGNGMSRVLPLVREACDQKIKKDRERGIKNRPVRAMVVGIPNVGKSTFINSFSRKSVTKTGNKPGVTKGKQWIRLGQNLELLDTPGILWPKFEDKIIGRNIAFIGSMNDDIINVEELSLLLIGFLRENYDGALNGRYDITIDPSDKDIDVMNNIAIRKSLYVKGGEIDYNRISGMLLDDLRSGRLGRISLESPEKEMK